MPSRPIRHARSNTSGPSASRCSLSCTPCPVRLSSFSRAALRLSSGSRLRFVTVEFENVGPHEHAAIVTPVSDALEQRDAVLTAHDRLAIDDAGARAQPRKGLDDQREATLPGRL